MTDEDVLPNTSRIMSSIKKKDSKPELLVRKFLFSLGFRYKLHDESLTGTPDIVLYSHGVVIFVDGCFWHGHAGCYKTPLTRKEFWENKIQNNIERDNHQRAMLEELGWRVFVIHECELAKGRRGTTYYNLLRFIDNDIYSE
ncbi:DNA mismatch endonuclease Vsr [Fibrella aestuarina]|uniref:Very short patch repair endonuclease n=2 Tax=Fibrivirga algicola TaxID=2950420 RepID=A0ABX0QR70_9BACT|nr:DNA mismatch endonuclease Vsr [Fibrivirga algicola]